MKRVVGGGGGEYELVYYGSYVLFEKVRLEMKEFGYGEKGMDAKHWSGKYFLKNF